MHDNPVQADQVLINQQCSFKINKKKSKLICTKFSFFFSSRRPKDVSINLIIETQKHP